jgi:hypothetical protein
MSVIGAIAARGGFTEKAYRQRVLVVRGSLDKPQTFIVNVSRALMGKTPDFALQPRDIIYVAQKPWSKAEDLLELAVSDFMRAVVISWTGKEIGPLIK